MTTRPPATVGPRSSRYRLGGHVVSDGSDSLRIMTWFQIGGPLLGVVVGAVIAAYFSSRQAARAERVARERFLTERRQLAYTDFLAAVIRLSTGTFSPDGTDFDDVLRGLECMSVMELIATPDTGEAATNLYDSALDCFHPADSTGTAKVAITKEFNQARHAFTRLARRDLGSN
jgi:hypothetical protein